MGNPAHAAVDVLGVFTDDDEVDMLGALALEGALDAGVELHGAQVDVLVELEAKAQQDALLEDAGGHARVADGAKENGIVLLQLFGRGGREHFAGRQVAIAAVIIVVEIQLEIECLGSGLEDLDCFASHFGTSAVATDYGEVVGARHVASPS